MSGISAQGSTLHIGGTAGGAKTITAITIGNPAIVTSAAHGFSNGDVVAIAAVVGTMSVLNGTSRVVSNKTANTFALLDFDSTGLTYTSGGTVTPNAWTKINGVQTFSGFDGQADELDTTDLDDLAKTYLLGLKDEGKFSFGIKVLKTDAGQIALRAARTSGAIVGMKLTLPDGAVATFSSLVKSFPTDGGVNAILKTTIDTRITGNVVWS